MKYLTFIGPLEAARAAMWSQDQRNPGAGLAEQSLNNCVTLFCREVVKSAEGWTRRFAMGETQSFSKVPHLPNTAFCVCPWTPQSQGELRSFLFNIEVCVRKQG